MHRFLAIMVTGMLCLATLAQNQIEGYCYWFDEATDQQIQVDVAPNSTLNLNTSLSTVSLGAGLHTLHVRFFDTNGLYSPSLSRFFYKPDNRMVADNMITGCEYWLDGNLAAKVAISLAEEAIIVLDEQLDMGTLKDGMHLFNIRFVDKRGYWSEAQSTFFYKVPVLPEGVNNIVAFEYWLNGDIASRQSFDISPVNQFVFNQSFDFSGLNDGLHQLVIRFKDNSGHWSPAHSEFFFKAPLQPDGTNNIVSYQYWLNGDMGTAQTVNVAPVRQLVVNDGFDFSDLKDGLHQLSIRFKDSYGHWSPAHSEFIYKKLVDGVQNELVAFEYWYDNELDKSITEYMNGSLELNLIKKLDLTQLVAGNHLLNFRFQDADGQWSGVVTEEFLKTATTYADYQVAYYPFDNHANDESGQGHHGIAYGVNGTADRNGNVNSAYLFDGVDDYIDLGDWRNGGATTITFWARWDANNYYSRIVDFGNGPSSSNMIVSNNGSTGRLYWGVVTPLRTSAITSTDAILNPPQWDFYALSVDESGVMKMYKNGTLLHQLSNSEVPELLTRTSQFVGRSNYSADGYFKGAIDELRIFNIDLSDMEITQQYNFIPTDVEIIPLTNVKTYPNPVNTELTVEWDNGESAQIRVFDMGGRCVYQVSGVYDRHRINTSSLDPGIYVLIIRAGNTDKVMKVVKQ